MDAVTESYFRQNYAKQFDHTPGYLDQIVAGAKFYGVANHVYQTRIQNSPIRFAEIKFTRHTSKTPADDHLMRIFGIDRGDAHSVMNAITHHSLPSIYDSGIDLEFYAADPFMVCAKEITEQERSIMPTATVCLDWSRYVKGERGVMIQFPPDFTASPGSRDIYSNIGVHKFIPYRYIVGNFWSPNNWGKADIGTMARKIGFIQDYESELQPALF